MTFISLVAALLLEQLRPLRSGNQLYLSFARYINSLARNFNAGRPGDGALAWTLAVVPIALLTALVYWLAAAINPVLVLLWNVLVLYLALGFRQFSHFFNRILIALRDGDIATAQLALNSWHAIDAEKLAPNDIARIAIELGLLRSHRHVFGVMAWFVVAGPVGAIVYRIAAMLNDRWGMQHPVQDDSFGLFAQRAFEIIDWIPARVTAMGFAVAGDFMGAVECWREETPNWPVSSQRVILAAAAGALGIRLGGVMHHNGGIEYRPTLGDGDEPDVDYMRAAVGLIWRALVLWLFLILLVTIASWF